MKHEYFEAKIGDAEGLKVSRQKFDGTNELAKYIKNTPINKIWEGERLDSEKRKSNGFNDFDSFDEAMKALEYGTDMYYKDFNENLKKVEDFISKRTKNKTASYKNDRVGFLPIVPKVLQGNPVNMINQDVRPKPYPTARIILDKSNSASISSADMCEFYAIIFVLIQLLEKKGIRCEIWVIENAYNSGEITSFNVKLKSYTQPLNMYKIQFPIIASDYLRRIMFRLLETNPDIKTVWTFGYGAPLLAHFDFEENKADVENIMGIDKNDIYIPSCQELRYHAGDKLETTIERIISKTKLKDYIKLDDEVIN